ncbi:MAG: alpha/beta hydrolase [Clostridiales bacterium]|nr:alpha/beta hydrolase [Clostridiales bacterium]
MKNSKLAVFFPGMGYTNDKPLLYYSRKMLDAQGFETKLLIFSGFPKKDKNNEKKMQKAFQIALTQAEEQLADMPWEQYEEVLFIGKSIGTAAAAYITAKLKQPVRQIIFTPLERTFAYPIMDAIVFTGTADPWVPKGRIPELCAEINVPCHMVEQGNHSLETGDWKTDLEMVRRVMTTVEAFLA